MRHAEGGYRLVAKFSSEPADVVLLDVAGLRQQDLDIINVLREIRPDVGIVALAERDQRDLAADALCAGADLYLLKPTYVKELLAAIDRAAMRRRPAGAGPPDTAASEGLSKLARGVAHEINNPLTTISGWLQMLTKDRAEDQQLADTLKSMKEESDRIAEVVRHLLAFAQQTPPKKEPVEMEQMLKDLVRLHSSRCWSKGVEFVADIPSKLPSVVGDAQQLRLACDGILVDAEESLDSSGRIEMSCRPSGSGIEIVFRDNGPAIHKEALDQLFEPFNPGRRGNGKGMRLCVSRGVIQSHGGIIGVTSDESSGTELTIWLPAKS